MRRTGQVFGAFAASAALIFAGTGAAMADDVSINPQSLHVEAGKSMPFTVQLLTDNKGTAADPVPGCNATPAAPVTISFTAANTWATVSPTSVQVTDCTTVKSVDVTVKAGTLDSQNTKITGVASGGLQDQPVRITTGQGSTKVTTTELVDSGFTEDFVVVHVDAPATVTPPPAPDADGDGIPDSSDTNSYAPAVDEQAGAADGNEGTVGNPATSGSFTDRDGNGTLTITKVSGAGIVVDNGNGTFSWSHTTTDDASGSVMVKASDGEHSDATQTFDWTAANVAPVITGVTQARNGACAVTLGATYTDAGSADTHTTSVLWADGSTALARTFPLAGSYDATVTVADDDGGKDSETLTGVRAYNTPSAVMQPINATGTRSGFKIGSTIPVKITVTGCDGAQVTDLTPAVNLVQGDTTPDVAVNESVMADSATNGKLMRWTDTQYVYNLSTKLSQFTGAALTQGTYTVSVNDPSFAAPVKAAFDLRK